MIKKFFILIAAIIFGGAALAQPRFSSQGHKSKVVAILPIMKSILKPVNSNLVLMTSG